MAIFTTGALVGNILLNLFSKKIRIKTIINLGILIEAAMLFALSITVSPLLVKILGSHSISLFLSLICIIIGTADALLNAAASIILMITAINEVYEPSISGN